MSVSVSFDGNWQKDVIVSAITAALEFEKIPFDCEIETIIVSPEEIKELNYENRGIDKVTDVLSFPMYDDIDNAVCEPNGHVMLGSMVICSDRAIEQAREYGHSVEREAAFLAVHSVLHLLGYDHELGQAKEKEMFDKQEQILVKMGLTR